MLGIYHAGELGVQARAGVQEEAMHSERVIKTTMKPVAQEFLHQQPMAVVATIDADGWVWASLVAGLPGFTVALDEGTIHMGAVPTIGDPLQDNSLVNSDVGLQISSRTHPEARISKSSSSMSPIPTRSIEQVATFQNKLSQLNVPLIYEGIVSHGEGMASGGIYFEDPDGIRLEIYSPTGVENAPAPTADAPT